MLSLALAAGLALFLILAIVSVGSLWHAPLAGDFHRVFPHELMVALFTPVFGFAVFALAIGVRPPLARPGSRCDVGGRPWPRRRTTSCA